MTDLTVGIDLGGTNITVVLVDGDNRIVARAKADTERGLPVTEMAERMRAVVDQALLSIDHPWSRVGEVGVALPGSVDPLTGDLLHAPNLGWKDEPAKAVFDKVFDRDTSLGNDVNCGMIGEYCAGAARGSDNAVGFFVGTGLGGGVIIDRRLCTGKRGAAGELGHQIVRYKGRLCPCGNRGCVEAYCSKVAFARRFNKLIGKRGYKSMLSQYMNNDFSGLRSKHLKKTYLAGDKVVCRVLDQGARMLGVATANLMAVLAPDCVVFGGGVMEALGQQLLPVIRQGMSDHLFGLKPEEVDLRLSALGDDAVPVGAARMRVFMNRDHN